MYLHASASRLRGPTSTDPTLPLLPLLTMSSPAADLVECIDLDFLILLVVKVGCWAPLSLT